MLLLFSLYVYTFNFLGNVYFTPIVYFSVNLLYFSKQSNVPLIILWKMFFHIVWKKNTHIYVCLHKCFELLSPFYPIVFLLILNNHSIFSLFSSFYAKSSFSPSSSFLSSFLDLPPLPSLFPFFKCPPEKHLRGRRRK